MVVRSPSLEACQQTLDELPGGILRPWVRHPVVDQSRSHCRTCQHWGFDLHMEETVVRTVWGEGEPRVEGDGVLLLAKRY